MIRLSDQWSKDQTLRCDAAPRRFAAEILRSFCFALQQPQHAAIDLAQQPHPDVEHGRRDLVVDVERAERKSVLREADLPTCWNMVGDTASRIRDLISVRQIDDFFRVMV